MVYGKVGTATGIAGTGLSLYDLKKISDLLKRVKKLETKLAEFGIGKPTGWADKVDKKLHKHETKLTKIENTLNKHGTRLTEIENRLDTLTKSHNNLVDVLNDRMKKIGNEFIKIGNKFARWRVFREIGREFRAVGRKFKKGI